MLQDGGKGDGKVENANVRVVFYAELPKSLSLFMEPVDVCIWGLFPKKLPWGSKMSTTEGVVCAERTDRTVPTAGQDFEGSTFVQSLKFVAGEA